MKILYRIGALSSAQKRHTNFMIEDRSLSEDWYQGMRKKTLVLWELQSIHLPWKASHENYDALKSYISEHQKNLKVATEIHLISDETQDAMMKIVQLVTNCAVSFTTFLTITELYMRRKYKDSTIQLDEWNLKRNKLHESCFSYRLGYELRNYSQHYGIPVSEIIFAMNPDYVEKLEAYVKAEDLLRGGFNWKKLKGELNQKENRRIELISLLFEYLDCVDNIYRNTIISHCDELRECHEFLAEICSVFGIAEGEHPVVFKGATLQGERIPREKEFIPLYLSNKMSKDWRNKLNLNITNQCMRQET